MESALISIHIGKAARMSCRRAGTSHTGSAVHGDIDIIPVGVPSVWQMHDENDRAVLMVVSQTMLNHVAEESGLGAQRCGAAQSLYGA